PPDLEAVPTQSGVFARPTEASGSALIEIWLTAPAAIEHQPTEGQDRGEWLHLQGWLPRVGAAGVTAVGDRVENAVLLPAGPAFEVVVTGDVGSAARLRVVAYAIETHGGTAILMIQGAPEVMDQ